MIGISPVVHPDRQCLLASDPWRDGCLHLLFVHQQRELLMAVPRTRIWLPFFALWVLLAVGCTAFPESLGSSANGSVMTVDVKGRELY